MLYDSFVSWVAEGWFQVPDQAGARFSANAEAPSRASFEAKTGITMSFWRAQSSSAGQLA
jgi:hypothetical protein